MIAISHTALTAFRRCPRNYQLRHVRGLEADRPPTRALGLGRLWHECIEGLGDGINMVAIAAIMRKRVESGTADASDVSALVAMLSGWVKHQGLPPPRRTEVRVECALRRPGGGSSPTKRWKMFLDGLERDTGPPDEWTAETYVLWEHKTKSSLRDAEKWTPAKDAQVMLYVAYSPVPITEIVYDVVERPTWKPKEDPAEEIALLYERYVTRWTSLKRRKKNETVADLMARRAEDGKPYNPFLRTRWRVDTDRVTMAQQDAWDTAQEMAACAKRGRYPRALEQCSRGFYGRECEFSMLCHETMGEHHEAGLIEAFYRNRFDERAISGGGSVPLPRGNNRDGKSETETETAREAGKQGDNADGTADEKEHPEAESLG